MSSGFDGRIYFKKMTLPNPPRFFSVVLGTALCCSAFAETPGPMNIELLPDHSVALSAGPDAKAVFKPRFAVLVSEKDPKPRLRWMEFGDQRPEGIMYNVMAWTADEIAPSATTAAPQHVEDGFDPTTDQAVTAEAIADLFKVAPTRIIEAESAEKRADGSIVWKFAETDTFTFSAELTRTEGVAEPKLSFQITPKKDGYYAVAYVGAPSEKIGAVSEIWQPLIWQEMRFPDQAYMTEAARCTIPATTVTADGVTWAVAADPDELPFQPLPTVANSTFGVAVRNADGDAQPIVVAPIPGGVGSKLGEGESFDFALRLFVAKGDATEAYAQLAQGLFDFHDYRSNDEIGPLNQTFESMVRFAMGPWGKFNDDLRGASYDTDVPGSVKNVSSLHPLSVALVTDSKEIFDTRARPMVEYALSRERFLFTTDPEVTGQSASAKIDGPGVPLSELTALEEFSGGRNPDFIELAKEILPEERSLNLEVVQPEDVWQNWFAIYRATGDKDWLDKAKKGADEYIQARIETPQTDYTDRESRGMFFWTSYAPNWIELFELYEVTGEKRYLEAAHKGARQYAQFVYLVPTIPDENVTVHEDGLAPAYRKNAKRFPLIEIEKETVPAWRVSEIGLTPESSGTSKGHRGIFPNSYAAYMLRVAAATGDDFLRAIGRSAIIGRYRSFPGYHINTARTTVYEKEGYAEREKNALNSSNSIHYNHIWPHISLLLDFLVSDVAARSGGKIDFPGKFSEGYAYFQTRVYGTDPGEFFGNKAILWMPPGLVKYEDPEINYVSARNDDGAVFLAFANQSKADRKVTFGLDPERVAFAEGGEVDATVWDAAGNATQRRLDPQSFEIEIPADGLTAVRLAGGKIETEFQREFAASGAAWAKSSEDIQVGNARASLVNFGDDMNSLYVFLRGRDGIAKATLRTSENGTAWAEVSDPAFPYEFSVPVTPDAESLQLQIVVADAEGAETKSNVVEFRR